DHLHRKHSLPAVERIEMKRWNVHVDVALAQRAWQPTMSLEVRADLSRASFRADVERRDRGAAKLSVGFEIVPALPGREDDEQRVLRRHGVTLRLEARGQLFRTQT